MMTVFLFVGVWLAIAVTAFYQNGWPDGDIIGIVMVSVLALLTLVVMFMLGVGATFLIGSMLPTAIDKTPDRRAALVSLRSSGGIEGQFFLGSGHIGTQLYYFWYEQHGSALTPNQHEAGRGTYVYEEDRTDAEVVVYNWHLKREWWNWFAFADGGETWEFHIPKGTIKQGYSL